MRNPWENISLSDYENHMSLDTVRQLQTMNEMMKGQIEDYPVEIIMILGIAGGNGLEHIPVKCVKTVYGVDINKHYLDTVAERYSEFKDKLKCLYIDLMEEVDQLPQAELIIANLLVEYVGYSAFQTVICQVNPKYVTCIIQMNVIEEEWVSKSPYIHVFDSLDQIHCQVNEKELEDTMIRIGYSQIHREISYLPNGKSLVRIDFCHRDTTKNGVISGSMLV